MSETETTLFERNTEAIDRAEKAGKVDGGEGGRTGYVERGFDNNSGNDSQSKQLDELDKDK